MFSLFKAIYEKGYFAKVCIVQAYNFMINNM